MTTHVACAVLAAGASRRLGHPKQLARHDGKPLVRLAAECVWRSRAEVGAVIAGAHEQAVRTAVGELPIEVVWNPNWQQGMAASIRVAAAWAEQRGSDALLLTLCDQPRLSVTHLDGLIAEFERTGLPVASFYAHKCAVPALFPRSLFGALAALDGDSGASHLLNDGRPLSKLPWADGEFDVDTVTAERELPSMKALKAVLLDVDGTLVDSNDAHAQAWFEVFQRNGYPGTLEWVRELIGKGGDKLIPEVTGLDEASHEAKRIAKERSSLFARVYLPQLRAFPGAEALVRRLHQAGLVLVVASSASKDELLPLLEACGALPFVQHQTSSDDAAHSKPDPDIVQVALRKAGCSAGEAVMLGDTPYDIEAASKAGVPTIALRSGGHPDSALRGALAIYDDVADLLANIETSVFALRH